MTKTDKQNGRTFKYQLNGKIAVEIKWNAAIVKRNEKWRDRRKNTNV